MELNAFTARLGTGQGRLAPAGASPGSDDFVFVLGDDEFGRLAELAVGDRAEVSQAVDLTGLDLVRANLRLRVPKSLNAGLAWEASIRVDGVKKAAFTCASGRERITTDLAANVSKLNGAHMVSVRLELVGG